jgi:hypothetical protein
VVKVEVVGLVVIVEDDGGIEVLLTVAVMEVEEVVLLPTEMLTVPVT